MPWWQPGLGSDDPHLAFGDPDALGERAEMVAAIAAAFEPYARRAASANRSIICGVTCIMVARGCFLISRLADAALHIDRRS